MVLVNVDCSLLLGVISLVGVVVAIVVVVVVVVVQWVVAVVCPPRVLLLLSPVDVMSMTPLVLCFILLASAAAAEEQDLDIMGGRIQTPRAWPCMVCRGREGEDSFSFFWAENLS